MSRDVWNMSKVVRRALVAGTLISALLLFVEHFVPGHSPRTVAIPGWIAIIFLWGFEGGRGAWPWVVFLIANALAYSYLAFIVLIAWRIFSRKGGVHECRSKK
jgi:hypothetical protein